jgi:hypothetical protein
MTALGRRQMRMVPLRGRADDSRGSQATIFGPLSVWIIYLILVMIEPLVELGEVTSWNYPECPMRHASRNSD